MPRAIADNATNPARRPCRYAEDVLPLLAGTFSSAAGLLGTFSFLPAINLWSEVGSKTAPCHAFTAALTTVYTTSTYWLPLR
mmetsp:Transcript_43524/g.100183  ORF Transcript_43524/g.100183 Transcript_43524/m.100183 type:complete len:82 (-) Transcript_43524:21-266(-)